MKQINGPTRNILIACIGNIFLGDDGFGVAVAQRLKARQGRSYPEGVQVVDFGIRGMELAYSLLDDYDALVLVDAVSRGKPPGTLYLIEPELASNGSKSDLPGAIALDAHSMDPLKVLIFAEALGARPIQTLLLGCEPTQPNMTGEDVEMQMGLSEPVQNALDNAVLMIDDLVARLVTEDH